MFIFKYSLRFFFTLYLFIFSDIAHDILQNFCPYAFLDGVCKNYNNCVFPHKVNKFTFLK